MIKFQNICGLLYDYYQIPGPNAIAAIPKTIDSEYAVNLIRKIPEVQEPITAEPLQGGNDPDAQLFLVTSPNNKFVIRLIKDQPTKAAREIILQRIASDAGYGPHVYLADPKLGVIVMAYIEQVSLEKSQFSSFRRHQALGEALSKMHNGPSFPTAYKTGSYFPIIQGEIQRLKIQKPQFQTIALRIERMISIIEKAISPSKEYAPCHNDLHLSNLLFSGSSFIIIDYGSASQDDPFFDLATAIIFNCFNAKQEAALLDAYFKRPISEKEKAKLFVTKQAALICAATRFFIEHPAQKGLEITPETVEEIVKNFWTGDDIAKQEAQSKHGHVFLKEAIANLESAEFQKVVELLSK